MTILDGGRPGDQRGFIHKKILGGISRVAKFLPLPAPIAAALSAATGFAARGRTSRPVPEAQKQFGQSIKFAEPGQQFPLDIHGGSKGGGPCFPPKIIDRQTGECVSRAPRTGVTPLPVGDAVMGQYGAALQPGNMVIDRAICLRGMQLGNDGLCYNKGQITNKQRMWPAGRKPLLSGGDMRAISIAARAGRRMELATKRLQRMGMMKKPVRRALAPHAHARAAKDVVSV